MNMTPKTCWSPVGDWLQISANKTLLLLNPNKWEVELGTISDSPTLNDDPRGSLWDLDHSTELDFKNYLWYSYACLPEDMYLDFSYEARENREEEIRGWTFS